MRESLCWLRCCRSRSLCSAPSWRPLAPFVTLTHNSRTFHKNGRVPRRFIENLRQNTTNKANTSTAALSKVRRSTACREQHSIRFYSQHFHHTPIMAEGVKWTGPQVRKTFLNFFEERGHTVGMSVVCLCPCCCFLFGCASPPPIPSFYDLDHITCLEELVSDSGSK